MAAPIAAIEMFQVEQLKGVPTSDAAKYAARSAALQAAKSYGAELSEEAAQEVMEVGLKAFMDVMDEDVSLDWQGPQGEIAQSLESLGQAALSLPFLGGPGHASSIADAAIHGKQRLTEDLEAKAEDSEARLALNAMQRQADEQLRQLDKEFAYAEWDAEQPWKLAQRQHTAQNLTGRNQPVANEADLWPGRS